MSCVIVLAPVVVAAWPVLTASVLAAAAAAGFTVVKGAAKQKAAPAAKKSESVELEVADADVVGDSMRADSEIVVMKDGVRVVFKRDARGRLQTCVEGPLGKDALREIGQDLSGRVVQQYVHRRLAEELGQAGFTTVNEDMGPDESIRLHVRRFEG